MINVIKSIMIDVTIQFLNELNSKPFYDERPTPYFEWDINCGMCEEWALLVEKKLEKIGIKSEVLGNDQFKRFEDLPNHIFIKIGKKYYDCECFDGVTKVMNLPIYSRNTTIEREDARKYSLLTFQST